MQERREIICYAAAGQFPRLDHAVVAHRHIAVPEARAYGTRRHTPPPTLVAASCPLSGAGAAFIGIMPPDMTTRDDAGFVMRLLSHAQLYDEPPKLLLLPSRRQAPPGDVPNTTVGRHNYFCQSVDDGAYMSPPVCRRRATRRLVGGTRQLVDALRSKVIMTISRRLTDIQRQASLLARASSASRMPPRHSLLARSRAFYILTQTYGSRGRRRRTYAHTTPTIISSPFIITAQKESKAYRFFHQPISQLHY